MGVLIFGIFLREEQMPHHEIERKFLIRYPDLEYISNIPGTEKILITQTYLRKGEKGENRRIRIWDRRWPDPEKRYIYTEKEKISDIDRIESETFITKSAYKSLYAEKDPECSTLYKARYRIPGEGFVYELDIFQYWKKQAILEIELSSEDEAYTIPDYLEVHRELTFDKTFTNHSFARNGFPKGEL